MTRQIINPEEHINYSPKELAEAILANPATFADSDNNILNLSEATLLALNQKSPYINLGYKEGKNGMVLNCTYSFRVGDKWEFVYICSEPLGYNQALSNAFAIKKAPDAVCKISKDGSHLKGEAFLEDIMYLQKLIPLLRSSKTSSGEAYYSFTAGSKTFGLITVIITIKKHEKPNAF
jgi:hypothetical protein